MENGSIGLRRAVGEGNLAAGDVEWHIRDRSHAYKEYLSSAGLAVKQRRRPCDGDCYLSAML